MSIFSHSLGSVITYDLLHESRVAKNIIHDDPVPRPPASQSSPVKVESCGGEGREVQSVQAAAGGGGGGGVVVVVVG